MALIFSPRDQWYCRERIQQKALKDQITKGNTNLRMAFFFLVKNSLGRQINIDVVLIWTQHKKFARSQWCLVPQSMNHTDSQSIQDISDEFCKYVLHYMRRQISLRSKIPRMIIEDVSGGRYLVRGRNNSNVSRLHLSLTKLRPHHNSMGFSDEMRLK